MTLEQGWIVYVVSNSMNGSNSADAAGVGLEMAKQLTARERGELDLVFNFDQLETPGHTAGSVCLLGEELLFAGDTLFAGTCGRCDLPGGSMREMFSSLHRLAEIPGDRQVLPGHGPSTTLADERLSNPYMRRALRK